MDYSLPEVYGRTGRTMGVERSGKEKKGEKRQKKHKPSSGWGGMWSFKTRALLGNLIEDYT